MRLLATLILCMTLVSCAVNRPDWYVSQGVTLSECGPAVGAMVVRITQRTVTTRFEARAFDPSGSNFLGWWSLNTIHAYLRSVGTRSEVATRAPGDVLTGVYHIDKSHFVIAQQLSPQVVRVVDPDPARGIYNLNADNFKSRVADYYVKFYGSIL